MRFNLNMLARNQKIRRKIKRKWNYLDYIKDLQDNKLKDRDKCLNKFY